MSKRITLLVIFVVSCLVPSSAWAVDVQAVNVIDYAAPNDTLNDNAGIDKAIAACQNGSIKQLHFSGGAYNLTSITFPANISVSIGNGSSLIVQDGQTVTFYGPFNAGLYNIFSSTGAFNFGYGSVEEVYPQWWPSKEGDDSYAIQKAVDSHPNAVGLNVKLIGAFNCKTSVNISRFRVRISGQGRYATQITFNPSTPTVLFNFDKSKDTVWQCSISDLAIYGVGDVQKIGIRLVNTSVTNVHNIVIQNFNGGGSIGLQIRGREMGRIEDLEIKADLPISIEANPYLSWISIDHFTFRNTYLITDDPNGPAVKIDSGLYLTNVVFDGTNAWCQGKYGLYWNDTSSTGVSLNLSIKNIRMEQGTATGGHIIHINHNYQLHNLVIENIYGCSGGVGGFYLRKCTNVTLQNLFFTSSYTPLPRPLDIDETSSNVVLINCYWNSTAVGDVSTGDLVKTFGAHTSVGGKNVSVIETWDRPDSSQLPGIVIYDTKMWCHKGNLADNESVSLPIGSGYPNKIAIVTVSATDGNSIIESGTFAVGGKAGGTTKLVTGTPNISETPAQGKLSLISGNKITLKNNLGTNLDILITVSFD